MNKGIRKTLPKVIDYDVDDIVPDWEQKELEEHNKIVELQDKYLAREREDKKKSDKREKLEKKKLTDIEKKELEQKADDIKKFYVLDYWMRCFNRVSHHNKVAGQALFHVVLGQAMNLHKINLDDGSQLDWRFNFLWLQDSGSGKGRAMNFINRVFSNKYFKKIEDYDDSKPIVPRRFKCHKLGRMNAASLINTFELDKKGGVKLDKCGEEIIKQGIIESNDFIFSEEARILLDSSRESMELQEIIMTAVETIGSVNNIYTKQLTNYSRPCETRCTASFALTTRPFGKVKQTLVESGLIQRMIFYPRKLVFEDREEMNKMQSFAFKGAKTETSFHTEFEKMIEELNKVVTFARKNTIDFHPDKIDDLLSFLFEKMMAFTVAVEKEVPNDDNRYILQTFVSRFKDNMVIMAFHSAAMRFSPYVERVDFQYAYDYFETLFEAQKMWISLSVEENRDIKLEKQTMKKNVQDIIKRDLNGSITYADLINQMASLHDKDRNAMKYHLDNMLKGSNPLIELLENPHDKRTKKVRLVL